MRLFTTCSPVIGPVYWTRREELWSLRSPWRVAMELEPVFWGEGDMLMFSGDYRDPVRGYRFRGTLRTEAIDENDLGILNEYRRVSRPLIFYPYGLSRPGWSVYIPGAMYRLSRSTPETATYEVELLGTRILTPEETKSLAVILDPEIAVTGGGPWKINARWLPMITAGRIILEVWDADQNYETASAPITAGKISFETTELESHPVRVLLSHDLSPYTLEVVYDLL